MGEHNYLAEESTTVTSSYSAKTPDAPWYLLFLGLGLSLFEVTLSLVFRPAAEFALIQNLALWLLNIIYSLGILGVFISVDIKRRTDELYYRSSVKTVAFWRTGYIVASLLLSVVFIYGVADELSRIWNVVR